MAEIVSLNILPEEEEYYDCFNSKEFSNNSQGSEFTSTAHRKLSSYSYRSSVFLKYDNISYTISSGIKRVQKHILDDVSGKINVGELTGILGPSGSGKTSLMNILSGYKDMVSNKRQKISGKILINGKDREIKEFRNISIYVLQDDYLFLQFTVKESMMVAAHLRMPKDTLFKEKEEVVKEIIVNLGLIHCQDTKVMNISGGERKRLCIALELIRDPLIMFLDEPTTGLDSRSCIHIITLLKSLANTGRTIVCTIHQPSSKILEYFNKLIFLAKGKCIYEGSNTNLVPFLETLNFRCHKQHNPADIMLDIASDKNGHHIKHLINANKEGWSADVNRVTERTDLDISKSNEKVLLSSQNQLDFNKNTLSNWTQYRILFVREILSSVRNKWALLFRLIFYTLTGILIGILYYDIGNNANKVILNAAGIHFSQVFLLLSETTIVVTQFPVETNIILREQINNWYNLRNYFFAKITADVPFQIVITMIFCSIFYWMSSQPNEFYRYVYFSELSVLTSLTSSAYGMMLGAGGRVEIAIMLAVIFSVPIVGFSGLYIRFNVIPSLLKWIASTTFIAYSFEGLIISIYGYDRDDFECKGEICFIATPKIIINEIGITSTDVYIDFIGVITSFLIFRSLTYFILHWKFKY